MKLVSVIVPVYNMETYFSRCMDSLLKQTYEKIEIILVDDGSTDKSASMCDDYRAHYPEIIRVYHKENGGLSSARNAGVMLAKGEYIIFPDPDDWSESDYIEKAVMFQKEHEADLVCLGYFIEYNDKCIPANDGVNQICMNSMEAKRALLLPPRMNGFVWNKLYRMDIISKYNLKFLDDVGTTEDLDFSFRYLNFCNKVCFAPQERVYHYYQRLGAATHGKFSKKKLDSINTYEKIICYSQNDQLLIGAAEEEICNLVINLIWLYKRDGCDDKQSWSILRQYLRKYIIKYLKSRNYNEGRKIQALLAYFAPNIYVKLKNRVQREDGGITC